MGNHQGKGSSDVPANPEAKAELGDQPAGKSLSDTGNETAKVHSEEGNASQTIPQEASQTIPQEEEVNSTAPPAGEPEPQKNSQEVGQPPDKLYELDFAKKPIAEPSSDKAEGGTPQIPLETAGKSDAEPGVVPLTTEGPFTDPELQPTAKTFHRFAEFEMQRKPCKLSPCSPTKKDECLGKCSSLEAIIVTEAEAAPEMVEGHSYPTTALVIEQFEVQNFVEAKQRTAETAGADSRSAESALVPTGETQAVHPAVDAQTMEGGPSESPMTQQALEVHLASNAVEHADTKFINGVQNDEGSLTTEAVHLEKEHPTIAAVQNSEAEPLPDPLAEPSTDSDKAKEFSLGKKTGESRSGSQAIEMAEVQAGKRDEHPQSEPVSSAEVTPAAHETQPVATAEVHTQLQGSSSSQKDSTEGPVHPRKHGPKFATSFYLCCSDCSIGDGESNAEQ